MAICEQCSSHTREGALICDNCGAPLNDDIHNVNSTRELPISAEELVAKQNHGNDQFGRRLSIFLHINGAITPIMVGRQQSTVYLGRSENGGASRVDVDLSRYDAFDNGVSRTHAAIHVADDKLMIVDMGSANGTFLNGQQLEPRQPLVLRDGDEICLGRLVTRVFFG
jgi:hypothetical protein